MNRLLTALLLCAAPLPALATPPTTTLTDYNRMFNPSRVIDLDWATYGHNVGDAPTRCPFPASGRFALTNGACQYNNPGAPGNGTRFKAWAAFKFDYDHDIATCGMNLELDHGLGAGLGNADTVMFYSNDGGLTWRTASPTATQAGWKYWFVNVGPVGDFRVILGRTEPFTANGRQLRWFELAMYFDAC